MFGEKRNLTQTFLSRNIRFAGLIRFVRSKSFKKINWNPRSCYFENQQNPPPSLVPPPPSTRGKRIDSENGGPRRHYGLFALSRDDRVDTRRQNSIEMCLCVYTRHGRQARLFSDQPRLRRIKCNFTWRRAYDSTSFPENGLNDPASTVPGGGGWWWFSFRPTVTVAVVRVCVLRAISRVPKTRRDCTKA